MQRISYVNGRYTHHGDAEIHIEDRGYQFADGIYEVIAVQNGKMIDGEPHLQRLKRSLAELEIAAPVSDAAMRHIIGELLRRNGLKNACVYIQVTRGIAKRNHEFPKAARPSLVLTVTGPKNPPAKLFEQGAEVITHPDIRWGRRDIKSIALLPNILAKQQAARAKVREAWLVGDDNRITEGSSSNSYIITDKNIIVTHPADTNILGGITRETVLALARKAGMQVEERPFTVAEALAAKEAFLTSTTSGVMPVVKIDDKVIGNGAPREVTQKLMVLYNEYVAASCMTAKSAVA